MDDLQQTINAYYKSDQNKKKAAQSLGIPRSTFQCRLKKAQERGYKPKLKVRCGTSRDIKYKITERPIRGVFFTDAHNQPNLSTDRFKWLAGYVNEIKPDVLVDGGDFDDLQSLCSHERNDSYKGRFKPSFQADLEASKEARQILHEGIKCNPKKYVTLGNHEDRLFCFEDRNPEVYGMMQHAYLSILKEYDWDVTMYREYLDIGGVDFTHIPQNGMKRPVGGKNVLATVGRESIRDCVFGHTHTKGELSVPKMGPNRGITVFNGGCFMPEGYYADYARNSQVRYWRGAHYFTIENGSFNIVESITIKDLERLYG